MKKALLLSTILLAATSAFAFGGIFGGGHKSHTYNGVDSIGVHIDPDNPINPPVFVDCNEDTETEINGVCCANEKVYDNGTKCCTTEGYVVKDGQCQEACPAERQCGEVCCGEGNMCNTATGQCCRQEYDGSMGECCTAGLPGYSTNDGGCCGEGTTPFISWYSDEEWGKDTSCCAPDKVYRIYDYDYELWRYYEQGCCEDTIYPGVGYKGWNVCCDHEPTDYTNNKGETFKVCWANDTECTTNAQCGEGYYCNIKNEENWSCNYPASGTCEAIGESTPASNITGLGNVIMSNDNMPWWAADNWCKAQGMRLANVEEINCYYSGTNDPIEEGTKQWGYCCSGNNVECTDWWSHWNWSARTMDATEGNYSPVVVDLAKAYGSDKWFWTATDFASDNSCSAFYVGLYDGYVDYYRRNYYFYYALCVE